VIGGLKRNPDVHMAAKSGTPSMDPRRATVPVSVPANAAAGTGETGVSAAVVQDTSAIDKSPDARANPPGQTPATEVAASTPASTDTAAAAQQLPPPTNHPAVKKKKPKKNQPELASPTTTTTPAAATTPAATTTPATPAAPPNPAAPATPQQ
jgi:hypothetical protein